MRLLRKGGFRTIFFGPALVGQLNKYNLAEFI